MSLLSLARFNWLYNNSFAHTFIKTAQIANSSTSEYKSSRICSLVLNNMSGHISHLSRDWLGCWTTISLQLKGSHVFSVLKVYQTVDVSSSSAGPNTLNSQQLHHPMFRKDTRSPQMAFLDNLNTHIEFLKAK